jgi:hypothetical protein
VVPDHHLAAAGAIDIADFAQAFPLCHAASPKIYWFKLCR